MGITLMQIKEKLEKIDWDVNVNHLNDDMPLTEQGLDSLDMINLLLCLEKEFAIQIPDEDLNKLKSLNDLVTYINDKVS